MYVCMMMKGQFKANKVITKDIRDKINALYNNRGQGSLFEDGHLTGDDSVQVPPSPWCPWCVPCREDYPTEYRSSLSDELLPGEESYKTADGTMVAEAFHFYDARWEDMYEDNYFVDWLIFILERYLIPNGYVLTGEGEWLYEDLDYDESSSGQILLVENRLIVSGADLNLDIGRLASRGCDTRGCSLIHDIRGRIREYNQRLGYSRNLPPEILKKMFPEGVPQELMDDEEEYSFYGIMS